MSAPSCTGRSRYHRRRARQEKAPREGGDESGRPGGSEPPTQLPVARQSQHQGAVQQVTATVRLGSGVQRFRGSSSDIDQRAHHVPPGAHADPDKLHVRVRLSALLKDGVTVTSAGDDFGISTPRRGVGAIWHRYRGPRLSDDPATEAEMLNRSYRLLGGPTSSTRSTRC